MNKNKLNLLFSTLLAAGVVGFSYAQIFNVSGNSAIERGEQFKNFLQRANNGDQIIFNQDVEIKRGTGFLDIPNVIIKSEGNNKLHIEGYNLNLTGAATFENLNLAIQPAVSLITGFSGISRSGPQAVQSLIKTNGYDLTLKKVITRVDGQNNETRPIIQLGSQNGTSKETLTIADSVSGGEIYGIVVGDKGKSATINLESNTKILKNIALQNGINIETVTINLKDEVDVSEGINLKGQGQIKIYSSSAKVKKINTDNATNVDLSITNVNFPFDNVLNINKGAKFNDVLLSNTKLTLEKDTTINHLSLDNGSKLAVKSVSVGYSEEEETRINVKNLVSKGENTLELNDSTWAGDGYITVTNAEIKSGKLKIEGKKSQLDFPLKFTPKTTRNETYYEAPQDVQSLTDTQSQQTEPPVLPPAPVSQSTSSSLVGTEEPKVKVQDSKVKQTEDGQQKQEMEVSPSVVPLPEKMPQNLDQQQSQTIESKWNDISTADVVISSSTFVRENDPVVLFDGISIVENKTKDEDVQPEIYELIIGDSDSQIEEIKQSTEQVTTTSENTPADEMPKSEKDNAAVKITDELPAEAKTPNAIKTQTNISQKQIDEKQTQEAATKKFDTVKQTSTQVLSGIKIIEHSNFNKDKAPILNGKMDLFLLAQTTLNSLDDLQKFYFKNEKQNMFSVYPIGGKSRFGDVAISDYGINLHFTNYAIKGWGVGGYATIQKQYVKNVTSNAQIQNAKFGGQIRYEMANNVVAHLNASVGHYQVNSSVERQKNKLSSGIVTIKTQPKYFYGQIDVGTSLLVDFDQIALQPILNMQYTALKTFDDTELAKDYEATFYTKKGALMSQLSAQAGAKLRFQITNKIAAEASFLGAKVLVITGKTVYSSPIEKSETGEVQHLYVIRPDQQYFSVVTGLTATYNLSDAFSLKAGVNHSFSKGNAKYNGFAGIHFAF